MRLEAGDLGGEVVKPVDTREMKLGLKRQWRVGRAVIYLIWVSIAPFSGIPFSITTSYADIRSLATNSNVFSSTLNRSRTLPDATLWSLPSESMWTSAVGAIAFEGETMVWK